MKTLHTSELHGETWKKSTSQLSKTKHRNSWAVDELRSSLFHESIAEFFLVMLFIESLAIQVMIRTKRGQSFRSVGPQPWIDHKTGGNSLSWSTSNDCYDLISERIFKNKVSTFRWWKELSIGTFLIKMRLKKPEERLSKSSFIIEWNLTGPV